MRKISYGVFAAAIFTALAVRVPAFGAGNPIRAGGPGVSFPEAVSREAAWKEHFGEPEQGVWKQGQKGWRFELPSGEPALDRWIYEGDDRRYRLDAEGIMLTGWHLENGIWHYLHKGGAMAYHTWIMTDGKWYFLDDFGRMLRNSRTPDGYYVGTDGSWDGRPPLMGTGKGADGGSSSSGKDGSGGISRPSGGGNGEFSPPEEDAAEEDGALEELRSRLESVMREGVYADGPDSRILNDAMELAVILGKTELTAVGLNYLPMPSMLAEGRFSEISSYKSSLETLKLPEGVYYINRLTWEYGHRHEPVMNELPPSCEEPGEKLAACLSCSASYVWELPPAGHRDGEGDAVCDVCGKVLKEFREGERQWVTTGLPGDFREMSFTCVDDDYDGGFLFLADRVIPREICGSYHDSNHSYTDSNIRKWLNGEFCGSLSVASNLAPVFLEEVTDGTEDYIFCLSEEEIKHTYKAYACGAESYWSRTADPELSGYALSYHWSGRMASSDVYGRYVGVRPAYVLEKPDVQQDDKEWQIGEKQIRKMNGEEYSFTCIDESFADASGKYLGALFFCDSVLELPAQSGRTPATDSDAAFLAETGYEWADSPVRRFLKDALETEERILKTDTTERYSYSGISEDYRPEKEAFTRKPFSGAGKTEDMLFGLSLEEALRYPEALWAGMEEPAEEGAGYWLRSAVTGWPEKAYMVWYQGEIAPESTENRRVGVRPAYVVRQNGV